MRLTLTAFPFNIPTNIVSKRKSVYLSLLNIHHCYGTYQYRFKMLSSYFFLVYEMEQFSNYAMDWMAGFNPY